MRARDWRTISVAAIVLVLVLAGCTTFGTDGTRGGEALPEGLYVLEIVAFSGGTRAPTPDDAYLVERYGEWLRLTPFERDEISGLWRVASETVHLLKFGPDGTADNERMSLIPGETTFRLQLVAERIELIYTRR